MAQVTAIFNQKGGVGKTTTTINLAAGVGRQKKRSLIIDLDSQGNATSGIGVEKNRDLNIFDVIMGQAQIEDVIVSTNAQNVDILPGSIDMIGLELIVGDQDDWPYLLKDAISDIKEKYDYIFIDCPPSLGINSIMGLVASDYVLITIQTEFYALEGTSQFMDTISKVRDNYNEDLSVIGVLMVMYDGRTRLSTDVEAEVKSFFGDLVFDTIIHRNVRLAEAPSYGQSIFDYDRISRGAWNYRSLSREFLRRVDANV